MKSVEVCFEVEVEVVFNLVQFCICGDERYEDPKYNSS